MTKIDFNSLEEEEVFKLSDNCDFITSSRAEIRTLCNKNGIIIDSCDGGIEYQVFFLNRVLTEYGVLQNGTYFHKFYCFWFGETPMMFCELTDDVKIDIAKMEQFRWKTHGMYRMTWLHDFVRQKLRGFK